MKTKKIDFDSIYKQNWIGTEVNYTVNLHKIREMIFLNLYINQ